MRVIDNMKSFDLENFTTVERARRRIQKSCPALKVKEVAEARFEKQQDYELYNQGYNVEL